jgi:hypothetical protein
MAGREIRRFRYQAAGFRQIDIVTQPLTTAAMKKLVDFFDVCRGQMFNFKIFDPVAYPMYAPIDVGTVTGAAVLPIPLRGPFPTGQITDVTVLTLNSIPVSPTPGVDPNYTLTVASGAQGETVVNFFDAGGSPENQTGPVQIQCVARQQILARFTSDKLDVKLVPNAPTLLQASFSVIELV